LKKTQNNCHDFFLGQKKTNFTENGKYVAGNFSLFYLKHSFAYKVSWEMHQKKQLETPSRFIRNMFALI
jgi:hypothetical protein